MFNAGKKLAALIARLRTYVMGMQVEDYFRLLSLYAIMLYTVQVATIGLSLAHTHISQGPALLVLFISALVALLYGVFQSRQIRSGKNLQDHVQRPRVWARQLTFLAAFILIFLFALWIAAYLLPDRSGDGNAYHIPTIHLWARQGYVHWITENAGLNSVMNGYPKGVELLGYILVEASQDSHWVNVCNLLFLPLGVMGIACIARALATSSEIALLAGMVYVLVPVNVNQATTTYVDSAYASCVIAFLAMWLYVQRSILSGISMPKTTLFPLGAATGLTLSARSSAAVIVGSALLLQMIVLIRQSSKMPSQEKRRFLIQGALLLFGVSVTALAGAGYWYLRNYLIAGSPLYPVGVRLAGRTLFPGISIPQAIDEIANTPEIMQPWPWLVRLAFAWSQGLWNWPLSIRGVDSRLGGLGFIWILGCIPAIAFTFCRKLRYSQTGFHRSLLLLLAVVVSASLLITPMNWWARYTVWLYALGLPCFAITLDHVTRCTSRLLVRLWVTVCLLLLIFEGSMCLLDQVARDYPGYPRALLIDPIGILRLRNWRRPVCYLFPEMEGTAFTRVFAKNSPVAIGPLQSRSGGRWKVEIVGQLSLPIGQREIIFLPATLEQAEAETVARQARYVIWDDTLPVPISLQNLAVESDLVAGFWLLALSADTGR